MTPAEIAAYVGAAAWAPQIAKYLYQTYAKPKLKLISAPTVSIGYSSSGPIVNLTTSISADRKDAVIEKMTFSVVHEKGEERELTWQ